MYICVGGGGGVNFYIQLNINKKSYFQLQYTGYGMIMDGYGQWGIKILQDVVLYIYLEDLLGLL